MEKELTCEHARTDCLCPWCMGVNDTVKESRVMRYVRNHLGWFGIFKQDISQVMHPTDAEAIAEDWQQIAQDFKMSKE